jgi:hypothetical protein
MNFWIDKLDKLVVNKGDTTFFKGMSRKEAILTCCIKLWNYRFDRNDRVSFAKGVYVEIDTEFINDTQPPVLLIKELRNEDIKISEIGLKNFKQLLK